MLFLSVSVPSSNPIIHMLFPCFNHVFLSLFFPWSNLPVLHTSAPTRLLSYFFLLEQSSGFAHFCPNPLAFLFLPLGVIFRFNPLLLQPSCFPLASLFLLLGVIFRFNPLLLQPACFPLPSTWSNLPVLHTFTPTRLLSYSSHLEQSSDFVHFCPNLPAPATSPIGANFLF